MSDQALRPEFAHVLDILATNEAAMTARGISTVSERRYDLTGNRASPREPFLIYDDVHRFLQSLVRRRLVARSNTRPATYRITDEGRAALA